MNTLYLKINFFYDDTCEFKLEFCAEGCGHEDYDYDL